MVDARLKRAQILALSKSGHTTSEIAGILKVNRSTVYPVTKRGTVQDLPRTGRPVSVTIQQLKNTVRLRVTRNPARSIRKLAKDLHVSRTTMQRLVRNKLHLRLYKYKKDRSSATSRRCRGGKNVLRYWSASLATSTSQQFSLIRNYSPLSGRTTTKT